MDPTIVLQKLKSIPQRFRLPTICTLCNQYHSEALAVCAWCRQLFKPITHCCQLCAYPLFDPGFSICGLCIKKPPQFDRAYIAYEYQEPLRSLLHSFKYRRGLYLGSLISDLMLEALPTNFERPDCLIPIPMHLQRLRQRGYNHTVVLAKKLASRLKVPVDFSSCQKNTNTHAQAHLSGSKRKKNLRDTFQVTPMPHQHVILIDDLLTTGSTANELAHALKKSGVQRVDIWCCARRIQE